ncbi:hypothetical protein SAMN04488553_1764 [Gramella sp. MAR_2010_147]|nr:hypothetical protein SAMN04488553_1764 [Gramella sp. MAR_2010_147]
MKLMTFPTHNMGFKTSGNGKGLQNLRDRNRYQKSLPEIR